MSQLLERPDERRALRLVCRAARDALDGRCAALGVKAPSMTAAVAALARAAHRLHGVRELGVGATAYYDGYPHSTDLRDFGALAAALEALPSPQLLTALRLDHFDADELGRDKRRAAKLAAALARFGALRRVELNLKMKADPEADIADFRRMPARAAAALSALRRLPALAELKLVMDIGIVGADTEPILYFKPPAGSGLLPWGQLESLALEDDGAAFLPVLYQPAVAKQLGRLQALSCDLNTQRDLATVMSAMMAAPLAPLWTQPWVRNLRRLRLAGLDIRRSHMRSFYATLPPLAPPGAPAAPPLLPAVEELTIKGWGLSSGEPDGLRRLLAACNLGSLRRLELQGFGAGARGEVAARASELTALRELSLGGGIAWRAEAGGLVAFLQQRAGGAGGA